LTSIRSEPPFPLQVHAGRLALIRCIHTAAWFSIESCVGYLRRAGAAAAVVAGECLVFAVDRFRCPLTGLAERAGATSGSVTDIYLPAWFARNLPASHVPLLVLIGGLHVRTLYRHGREARRPAIQSERVGASAVDAL
jgi:hypothetical protein